jgi:anti-anti-sigma regulatory factor
MLRERPAQPGVPAQLDVEVYWDRGEALIIVRGKLDGVSAADLAERVIEIAKVLEALNTEPRRVVVDLAGAGFVNEAAVRALDAARQQLSAGCTLLLRSPSRAARKIPEPRA